MTNNLEGGRGRGFFAFPITLSFVFFCTSTSSVTFGFHRCPTRTGWRKEGDSTTQTCTDTTEIASPVLYIFYSGVIRSVMCQSYGIGYAYRLPYGCLCTVLYSIYKFECLMIEAILVDKR